MRIALFGGTFDPVHNGHLHVAGQTLRLLGYEQIVFVPAYLVPLRSHPPVASALQRLQMLRLATASEPRYRIDTWELDRRGLGHTTDVVRHIIETRHPDGKPGLIIGDDLIPEVSRWREAEHLLRLVRLIIAGRQSDRPTIGFAADWIAIDNLPLPVSSSETRELLRIGHSVKDALSPSVLDYITKHGLYRA